MKNKKAYQEKYIVEELDEVASKENYSESATCYAAQ